MTNPGDGRARPEAIKAVPVRRPGRWVAIAILLVLGAQFVHMLLTNEQFMWGYIYDHAFTPPVLEGVWTTLRLTVGAMVLGILLGVLLAVMRLSDNPILSGVSWLYTWFFRAVPRIVLAVLFGNMGVLYAHYTLGLPFSGQIADFLGVDLDGTLFSVDANTLLAPLFAGLLALALSEAAYMAEIIRAGIQSVDPGQAEAAEALGMSRPLLMRRIVLPQAMRVVIPPTGNETIAMLKDTAILAAVPVTNELFFQLRAIGNREFRPFQMLVAACLWYLVLTSVLMVGQYFLERRFSRGHSRTGQARTRLRILGKDH
ncbi:polar amino acid transport system permease protein [Actinocorallia herbida]|uniref:Polar amino acid transport system permease protein n=1 Tax=Actinocorallia herbida TaxID=58109 RepID=A0A3N1D5N7_9ACTN|nr:amino acid ABC transporter permease [Actinocorallia herbida]ROO88844.1 polar amino acid transport system permease protein [Actinocorallia herbida]